MIYLSIDEKKIKLLLTRKKLFKSEMIGSSIVHDLPDGTISGNCILSPKYITSIIDEKIVEFKSKSDGKEICIIIPDRSGVFLQRFIISKSDNLMLEQTVMEKAKNEIGLDPRKVENYYEVIFEDETRYIVQYASLEKKLLSNICSFVQDGHYKLKALTSESFAVYQVLKPYIGKEEIILYVEANGMEIKFRIFDHFGLIDVKTSVIPNGNFEMEVQKYLHDVQTVNNLHVSQIILAKGRDEIINTENLTGLVNIPVVLADEVLDRTLGKIGMEFDTGGFPKGLFTSLVGQIIQNQQDHSLNFAEDIEDISISKDEIYTDNVITAKQATDDQPEQNDRINALNKPEASFETNVESVSSETGSTSGSSIVEFQHNGVIKMITGKKNLVIMLMVVVCLLGLASFTAKPLLKKISSPFAVPTPTTVPVPTIMPTDTPVPTVNPDLKRSDLKILVENGTTKTGYAKEIADFLVKSGYKDPAKSNADKNDYEKSLIRIKNSKKEFLQVLVSDLKSKMEIANTEPLDDLSKFDAEIILGKQ